MGMIYNDAFSFGYENFGGWQRLCRVAENTLHHYTMRTLLYLIAVILVIGWLLGFFYYNAGGLIHILIVIAVISLLLGIIRRA